MIDVRDSRELQAVVLALKSVDRDLRSRINKASRDTMNPVWKQEVTRRATRPLDARLLVPGTRIAAGNPARAIAASSTRGVGRAKTLSPATNFAAAEFGVDRNATATYTRRNRVAGGTHEVTRHTRRGLPARNRKGRVVYPAFAEIGPRMVSLWVQTIVKTVRDAAEGK